MAIETPDELNAHLNSSSPQKRRDELFLEELSQKIRSKPDPSGFEGRTARRLVTALRRKKGLNPRLVLNGTGVVCDIGTNKSKPLVLVRVDIDALTFPPSAEGGEKRVIHACGHHLHATWGVGVAYELHDLIEEGHDLPFRVRVVFQPAEEKRIPDPRGREKGKHTGAVWMMKEGVLDGVDVAISAHNGLDMEVGDVAVRRGQLTAHVSELSFKLTPKPVEQPESVGSGAGSVDDAITHLGRKTSKKPPNVLHAGSDVVVKSSKLLSRRASRRVASRLLRRGYLWKAAKAAFGKEFVFEFGKGAGGGALNVTPSEYSAAGYARTHDPYLLKLLPEMWDRAVRDAVRRSTRKGFRRKSQSHLLNTSTECAVVAPSVVNDPELAEVVSTAVQDACGKEKVKGDGIRWGGEDFGWYRRGFAKVPGVRAIMFRIGSAPPGRAGKSDLHRPKAQFSLGTIKVGTQTLVHGVFALSHFIRGKPWGSYGRYLSSDPTTARSLPRANGHRAWLSEMARSTRRLFRPFSR